MLVTNLTPMNKLPLLCCCLFFMTLFMTQAQVQKSDQNLGFGFDINSISGDSKDTRTNLYVAYTYFLTKNLSIGFGPRFSWTKQQNSDTVEAAKSNTIGYNLFFNYSFLTNDGFVLPYFGAQYTRLAQKQAGNDDPFITTSVGGNVGLKFFITERLNVDNNFSITRVISQNDVLDALGVDVDGTVMQINVGIGYIIGRKN